MPKKKSKARELERSSINEGAPGGFGGGDGGGTRRSMRNSLADPSYRGDDYNVDWEIRNIGPLKKRGCSDLLFALLFIAFVLLMGVLLQQSVGQGEPEVLVRGIDSDGNICGFNESVKDFPYLYYIVQAEVTVTAAPGGLQSGSESVVPVEFASKRELQSVAVDVTYDIKTTPICIKSCPPNNETTTDCTPVSNGGVLREDLTKGVNQSQCQNLYDQADIQLKLDLAKNETDPTKIEQRVQDLKAAAQSGNMIGYKSLDIAGMYCLPSLKDIIEQAPQDIPAISSIDLDNIIGDFGMDDVERIIQDIQNAKYVYIYATLTCIVIAVVYCILLKFFAKLLIWLSILITGIGLIALALFANSYHGNMKDTETSWAKTVKAFEYILFGVAAIYFLCILCLYKGIKVSIAVLETSAVVIIRNFWILIVPFVSSVVILAYVLLWFYGAVFMTSQANIELPQRTPDDYLTQFRTINLDGKEQLKWKLGVYLFGLFWIAELLAAIFHYALIVGVCTWYFTSTADSRGRFSLMKGFWWSFRYNLGSLALGSFILALIWMVRIIFEYFQKKLERLGGDNSVTKCATCVIRCCLDCCHRFVKFLNKNAYIQVALTGKNFCSSAMDAFVLALKNSSSFIITNGIGYLIQLLGKLTITLGNVLITYVMLTQLDNVAGDIGSPYPPLVLILFMSYVLASIFMSIYSIVSISLLQCLYADVDLCNQSGEDIWASKQRPIEMAGIVNILRKH